MKGRWNGLFWKHSLCTCISCTDTCAVLRPGQVWQLCLLLDYATLTTQQPGKVRPYRVSERRDDDVSPWCLRFSPLDFVVFPPLCQCQLFAHLLGTCLPSELDSRTVNPLSACRQTFSPWFQRFIKRTRNQTQRWGQANENRAPSEFLHAHPAHRLTFCIHGGFIWVKL